MKDSSAKDKATASRVFEEKKADWRNRKVAAIQVESELESLESSDEPISVTIVRTSEIIKNVNELCEERQLIPRKPDLFADVKLEKCKVRALIDTGAQISMITKDLYDELRENGIEMTEIPITKFPVRGAFSDKGEIIANKIFVEIEIGEKKYNEEFYIAKRLPYRMLLGIEFLMAHQAIIECASNRIELQLDEESRIMAIEETIVRDAP